MKFWPLQANRIFATASDPGAAEPRAIDWLALLAILGFAIAFRTYYFVGTIGSDDLAAWNRAAHFAKGHWGALEQNINIIATTRYGLSVAAAPFFFLFGVSEVTANLFPMLMSLVAITALWDLTRRLTGSVIAGHLAALCLASMGLDIFQATILLPDGPMAAAGLVAIWLALVAYDLPIERDRLAAALYLLAGFVAGFAISLKEPGVVFIAGIGLWALTLMVFGGFRKVMLWGLLGFALAVAIEHLLVWYIHGDAVYRWEGVWRGIARNRDLRLAGDTEFHLGEYLRRVGKWLNRLNRELPTAAAPIYLGLVGATVLTIFNVHDRRARLLACVMLVFVVLRLPEFWGAFSFQPRRVLPGAQLGLALFFVAFWWAKDRFPRWPAGRKVLTAMAVLFPAAAVASTLLWDSKLAITHRNKLSVERGLFVWIREKADAVQREGLYTDHRTLRIISAISGYRLGELNVHAYPAYWGQRDGRIVEPESPLYEIISKNPGPFTDLIELKRGFWAVNPRYIRWMRAEHRLPWLTEYVRGRPPSWNLLAVLASTFSPQHNGAIFRIAESEASSAFFTSDWQPLSQVPDPNRSPKTIGAAPLSMDALPGGAMRIKAGSNGARIVSRAIPLRTNGSVLAEEFAAEVEINSLDSSSQGARATMTLIGDSEGRKTKRLASLSESLGPSARLTAFAAGMNRLDSFRIEIRLSKPGSYTIGPIRIWPQVGGSVRVKDHDKTGEPDSAAQERR